MLKSREFEEAMTKIREIIADGALHGFFDCSISCQVLHQNNSKRELTIKSGKSFRYVISIQDLKVGNKGDDHGDRGIESLSS